MNITAKDIKELLKNKHRTNDDIFVDECKVGSSWNNTMDKTCYRLDAWAMKKSWTNPTTWGYEIKVSRSDFLNDNKWQNYLTYCSDFYFVCPKGIIKPEELAPEVGLITVNGSRLYTAKKAIRRNIQIPDGLYRYIMMSRVKITSECLLEDKRERSLNFWKGELKKINECKEVGWMLSEKINKMCKDKIENTELENEKLVKQNKNLEHIKQFCIENNIDFTKQV